MIKKSYFFANIIFSLIFLLILSLPATAAPMTRGVNYDPIHSVEFAHGMGTDNADIMRSAIMHDLDQLKELQIHNAIKITHLKTFFTEYVSLHATAKVNIADIVDTWNKQNPTYALTLGVGVYEFKQSNKCGSECASWTHAQVNAVEQALLTYNKNKNTPLIDRVFVGNEDMQESEVNTRIANDISSIKKYLHAQQIDGVAVGTAQISGYVMDMFKGDSKYKNIFDAADFIGTNVYPFWGGVEYKSAKSSFESYWKDLKKTKLWGKKEVIETEEGWPSSENGDPNSTGRASLNNENDYFYYWYHGHASTQKITDDVVAVSYYFALIDKLPLQGIESNWGLISADNSSNILDNYKSGGKQFESNIIFPTFNNYIGANKGTQTVYNKSDTLDATVLACTEDNAQGKCYPLYGYNDSGILPRLTLRSWSADKQGWSYSVNKQSLMIDKSLNFYKSILVIANDGKAYPGMCFIDAEHLKQLTNETGIDIYWPTDGQMKNCKD